MALIKCPECGKEISDMAQSCPNCGRPLDPSDSPVPDMVLRGGTVNPNQASQQPPRQKKKGPGCLVSFLIIVGLFAFLIIVGITAGNSGNTGGKSVLARALDLSPEQESAMIEIFQNCGIGEIVSASHFQSGDAHTSYHLEDEETDAYAGVDNTIVVWVTNETKSVEAIYFRDQEIYVDGEIIAPITNYYVNAADRDKYRTLTQELIKQVLNYPDTAKFRGITAWNFEIREDGAVVAQSTVEAKNALGMESTMQFQIVFVDSTPISLIIDNQEYIAQ